MEKQVHVSFYASLFRTECKVLTLEEIIILIRRALKNRTTASEPSSPKLGTPRKRQEPRTKHKKSPGTEIPGILLLIQDVLRFLLRDC